MIVRCKLCESDEITVTLEKESFSYGSGKDEAILTAEVPVVSCQGCGSEYVPGEAEVYRAEAVAKHLNVISPSELLALRYDFRYSREDFSALTGVGNTSLYRWEKGLSTPSLAVGHFLKFLKVKNYFREYSIFLNSSNGESVGADVPQEQRFPHLVNMDQVRERSENFALH